MTQKRSKYNDDEIAGDIARGELTQAAMAEKYGLSERFIGQLVRGERRPDLQAKIEAVVESMLDQSRRLGARLSGVAMARLGSLAAKTKEGEIPVHPEIQRKAAVDILKFAHGDPAKPEINVTQAQSLPGLTRKQLDKLAEMEGGPK